MIFNNIFAASYSFYSRYPNESPRFTSVCLITLIISTISILVLVIASKIINYNILSSLPNKYYYYPIFGVLLFGVHKFYNSNRVELILSNYMQKNLLERRWWGFGAIFMLVAPIVIIAVILTK
jgi:glucose uptake protein GlcU